MTITLVFGSVLGFLVSIAGYCFAGLGLLAAVGIYLATPLVLVAMICAAHMVRPRHSAAPDLAILD